MASRREFVNSGKIVQDESSCTLHGDPDNSKKTREFGEVG
jgi:hypothetical protein